jgi:hypothetical protein
MTPSGFYASGKGLVAESGAVLFCASITLALAPMVFVPWLSKPNLAVQLMRLLEQTEEFSKPLMSLRQNKAVTFIDMHRSSEEPSPGLFYVAGGIHRMLCPFVKNGNVWPTTDF